MLVWISPLRNALLLAGLSACFIIATLAFTLIGEPRKATSPVHRMATASPQVDPDAAAIYAMRPHRLDTTATPDAAPSLKEILDSAVVLVEAGTMPAPAWWPISAVAAAAVTPTSTPVPPPPPTPRPTVPPAPPPAPVQRQPAAPPPPPPPVPAVSGPAYVDRAFSSAVWDAVNAVRARNGLGPLAPDDTLSAAASDYALDLAAWRLFSHTGADGSTIGDRLSAFGITNVAAGEVLAMGEGGWPATAIAQSWYDSAPHRSIILGAYTRAGVACAVSQEDGAPVVRCVMELAA